MYRIPTFINLQTHQTTNAKLLAQHFAAAITPVVTPAHNLPGHSGVIRAVNFHHSVAGGNVTQAVYTVRPRILIVDPPAASFPLTRLGGSIVLYMQSKVSL